MSSERDLSEYYEREAVAGVRAAMGSRGRRDDLRSAFVDLLVREGRESVVDVGSGPGTDAAPFIDAGVAYAGFDLAIGNARISQTTGLAIVPASLFAPPFRAHAFDAGWTMSTLLHVPDDRFDEAVATTTALMRPGAPLAIGLWGGADREFVNDTDSFDPPRFFSHRTDDRIQMMLSAHAAVESFVSWPTDVTGWNYQFIVVRV